MSIKGWNKSTRRNVPRLVTYDWLEDSLDDNKPMPHFWAYDPSKPRDIEAMLAGRRKASKKANTGKAAKTLKSEITKDSGGSSDHLDDFVDKEDSKAEVQSQLSNDDKIKTTGTKAAESQIFAMNKDQQRSNNPKPSDEPVQKKEESIHQDPRPSAQMIPKVDNRPWEEKVKARIFHDRDNFPYHIELTRKDNELKWTLDILESTSSTAPKEYRFRAVQHDAKSRTILRDQRDPVPSSKAALRSFSSFFLARTGYAWGERLVRAQAEQPHWRYRAPAPGRPTGSVPQGYIPGQPGCVANLSPIATILCPVRNARAGRRKSLGEGSTQRRFDNDKLAQHAVLDARIDQSEKKRKVVECLGLEKRPMEMEKKAKK